MTLVSKRLLAVVLLVGLTSPAANAACRPETYEGEDYTVCSFDLTNTNVQMFWREADGSPYRTFSALQRDLGAQGRELAFAINGGMYADDLSPIGLYVEDGEALKPANVAEVRGAPGSIPNFYKKPNGIFFVAGDKAGVMTTEAYLKALPEADFATQSGPMLVIDGALHPAFIVGSNDRKPRNGVGMSSPTEVHFAITEGRVNFHNFARFFRDRLGCEDALFLDGGSAPGIFAPELGRDDPPGHGGYGPIIGVVAQ